MADQEKVMEILKAMAARVEEKKEELTELDRPIGDSDHGINLARGFEAVEKKLPQMEDMDIGAVLRTAGMTLVSTVGGASGPLYGSAFMKAGMELAGRETVGMEDFLRAMRAAAEAVKQRGRAVLGEATMVDAMIPSLEAMEAAAEEGRETSEILRSGIQAAWAGAEKTKGLVATKGRASYVGERGLGCQDPGATSYAYLLEVIGERLGA